jgi:hypothetical protein
MRDIIRWKSRQKGSPVQNDIDNGGIIPFVQAIHCKSMMRSVLYGSKIVSSSYLGTGSSESVIFQLSKVYSNRIVV